MYAKIYNGQVIEYPIVDIRKACTNVSLPAVINSNEQLPEGYVIVRDLPLPEFDSFTEKPIGHEVPVLSNNGEWVIGYDIVSMTDTEIDVVLKHTADIIRQERNARLAKTDWTQSKDIPSLVSDAWAIYRQELRDITLQPTFPKEVYWPQPLQTIDS